MGFVDIKCCVCGDLVPAELRQAIVNEIERRDDDDPDDRIMPIIGIICAKPPCQLMSIP